jgi:hypothetical protein
MRGLEWLVTYRLIEGLLRVSRKLRCRRGCVDVKSDKDKESL